MSQEATGRRLVTAGSVYTLSGTGSANRLEVAGDEAVESTLATSSRNALAFKNCLTSQEEGIWNTFSKGGYFYNASAISGTKSIVVTLAEGSSLPVLSYGWASGAYEKVGVSLSSGTSYAFNE